MRKLFVVLAVAGMLLAACAEDIGSEEDRIGAA